MKLFLALLALALLWGGSQNVYTSLKNSAQSETTCAQLLAQTPDAQWLSLTDCEYDLENLAYAGVLSTVSELYVPLRPKADTSNAPPKVVLFTKDPQLLEIVRAMEAAPNADQVLAHAERLAEVVAPQSITGLVKFGIDLDADDVKKLREITPSLAQDFLLLHHGERPMSLGFALSLLGAGLLLSAFLALSFLRSRGQ